MPVQLIEYTYGNLRILGHGLLNLGIQVADARAAGSAARILQAWPDAWADELLLTFPV